MIKLNRWSLILAFAAFLFVVVDYSDRMNIKVDGNNAYVNYLPTLTVLSNITNKTESDLLTKYLEFDVRWQKKVDEINEALGNDSTTGSTLENLKVVAIFYENKSFAVAHILDNKNKFIRKIKLTVGQSLGEYQVKAINENTVELTTRNESIVLTLFKPTNNITLSAKNDE